MSGWRELDIVNLPSDIFKPYMYDFEWVYNGRRCGVFQLEMGYSWADVIAGQINTEGFDSLNYRPRENTDLLFGGMR